METLEKHDEPVILFVKVSAKADSIDKAHQALSEDVIGARTEAGNYKMELYHVRGAEQDFYLFERWQSSIALGAHFKQPYTQGAFDLQNGALTAPIEMNYLTDLWPTPSSRKKEQHIPLTTLIVNFEVKPGKADDLIYFFESFVPKVRMEPGNVEFHFHRVNGSDTRFVLYERWESQQNLDVHNALSTTAQLVGNITPLLVRPVADSVLYATDIS